MNISDNPAHHLDLSFGPWRKSSFSNPNGNQCVEVAVSTNAVALRDSKNPNGPTLVFNQAEWSAFVAGVAVGEFRISQS